MLSIVAAAGARAQDTIPVRCDGQRIAAVSIHSAAPSVAIFKHVPTLATIANAIHRTTDPEIINRFLLLHEGDRCNELRRAESERILRAQPFIAEAQIRIVPDSGGEVTLDVRTTDEVALVLGAAVGRGQSAGALAARRRREPRR